MTKIEAKIHWSESGLFWALAAITIVAFYFFGLTIPLVGPDEPRYSQVAREMFDRGDWITPTLGGFKWFEKPALLYWLQIASYHIFGVTEFAARFGSALFGLGTIASLWLLGRNVSGPPAVDDGLTPSNDKAFANWLALIAASSIGILVFSRGASFDIILTFPLTAALVSFFIFDRKAQEGVSAILPLFSFYFFVGAALLAKGLIGIVFPFAIVAFYYVLSRRIPGKTFVFSLFWGTCLSAAVASLWYVPMYLTHGWAFIDEFFIQHHFQRYTSNKYFHPQPFYFFFWILPLMSIPWLPFFLASIRALIKGLFYRTDAETNPNRLRPLLLFSLAWLFIPLVFFSFSGSKLPGYILPSLPPVIIMSAIQVNRFAYKSNRRKNLILVIAFLAFAIPAILLVTIVPTFTDTDSVKGLVVAADEKGLGNLSILSLHMISHNAEFYASGRLVRQNDGKQKRFNSQPEVINYLAENQQSEALVLIPLEHLVHLTGYEKLQSKVIRGNTEIVIAHITVK